MELAREIREINKANGWNVFNEEEWSQSYKIPAILALIHSETSEALEAFRNNDRANFLEEMADTVIRVLDCIGAFPENFDQILRDKLEVNKTRGFRHGGKKV